MLTTILLFALIPAGPAAAGPRPEPWTGDFEGMVARRVIRALVPYSRTFYFVDRGRPMGLSYEGLVQFEKMINTELKSRHLKIHVVVIPTPRERLLTDLTKGLGDLAAGNLTITKARQKKVAFSAPFLTQVRELPVTGADVQGLTRLEDLAGREVHVRKTSSYHDSLKRINGQFKAKGLAPMKLVRADEVLEDEDLLEMVNAGILPMVVVDSHKARFWSRILKNIRVHETIAVREGGEVAWALRKNTPQLLAAVNRFVNTSKKGTLMGNIMFRRYLEQTDYIRNPGRRDQFEAASEGFKKYGRRYNIDWLLLKALAFQESGINQNQKSPRGAIGVMQVLPSTARDTNVNIPDIQKLDSNIHAGTKYLRFLMDRYFSDSGIAPRDRILLSLAAYNAGPRQVARLRNAARKEGLDPQVWFKHVEVAAARIIGRETVQYVSNIFKYYIAYRQIYSLEERKTGKIPDET